jgi:aldehyde dehydrogenase family 7 protein A1
MLTAPLRQLAFRTSAVQRTFRRTCASLNLSYRAMSTASLTFNKYPFLSNLGLSESNSGVFNGKFVAGEGELFTSVNPATNEPIATITTGTPAQLQTCIAAMDAAKPKFANLPLPVRGELVRKLSVALRAKKADLGALVSLEMGKISAEGLGEVQEAIDICDFAVGLSRMPNGSIIPSERPDHFMMERYTPLQGHVAIITAFNFPCAVFFWNAALSLVAGNTQLWKGADSTSLITIACQKIVEDVLKEAGYDTGVSTMIQGTGATVGNAIIADKRFELVSFTGSTKVGHIVSDVVSKRFGKKILELGGNNAMVVMNDADLSMAASAALFSAVGTCGQRCTSLRRLMIQEGVFDEVVAKLVKAYKGVRIGDPLEAGVLCGPLHNQAAVKMFADGIQRAVAQGGKILAGGKVLSDRKGNFVEPTIIEISSTAEIIQEEIFAPILYVIRIKDLAEGIKANNAVPQGLSSSLFTTNQAAVFEWTGPNGSDCGIVNVNIGTSGAEIGGAFGGEKETGGGRESGSDAWKQYMRRSTCTINHSKELPLAQGISFDA